MDFKKDETEQATNQEGNEGIKEKQKKKQGGGEETPLERMRAISESYNDLNSELQEDDNNSLEEDAKRNIEGKFSFRTRLHSVLGTVQRELPSFQNNFSQSFPSQQRYQNINHITTNRITFDSRRSFNVFESHPTEKFSQIDELQQDLNEVNSKSEESQSMSSSIPLSNSTFSESSDLTRNMNSPRAAMIQEGHKRHQIPFVIKELVGNVDVEQISVINLAGQGIGDEKMNCLVRSLPYFIHVDEINISSKIFHRHLQNYFEFYSIILR